MRWRVSLPLFALFLYLACTPPDGYVTIFIYGGVPALESPYATARSALNLRVFDRVWDLVDQRYYDPALRGVDWPATRQKYRPLADTAATEQSLYHVINTMLGELKDAHLKAQSPIRRNRSELGVKVGIGMSGQWVENQFVVTEAQEGSPLAEAGVRPGWVLSAWNGTPLEAANLSAFQDAVHARDSLALAFVDAEDRVRPVTLAARPYWATKDRTAFRLDGGIFYIRFPAFQDDAFDWFEEQLERNADARAFIVDLRGNPGGKVSVLKQTIGLFYPERAPYGKYIYREGTEKRLYAPGAGRSAYRQPVVVLVNERSSSAAEIFSATLQEGGRATVVGRKTGGNVLSSIPLTLPDGGKLNISIRDFVTARGARLEGEGVVPDIEVPLELSALRQLVDRDLEAAFRLLHPTRDPSKMAVLAP